MIVKVWHDSGSKPDNKLTTERFLNPTVAWKRIGLAARERENEIMEDKNTKKGK